MAYNITEAINDVCKQIGAEDGATTIAEAIDNLAAGITTTIELPAVSATDNGKILGVVGGVWAKIDDPRVTFKTSPATFTLLSNIDNLEVDIPSGVTAIGLGAFSGCTGLKKVTFPDSVTTIGNEAFQGCTGLTGTLDLNTTLQEIGQCAFKGCTGITEVTIPNSVTSIGGTGQQFAGCTSLETVVFTNGANTIPAQCFAGDTALTDVTIPEGVTTVGTSAFVGCTGLEEIALPSTLTGIGDTAFASTGLTEVDIPETVTSIGTNAFAASSITAITLHVAEGTVTGAPWGATNATVTWAE